MKKKEIIKLLSKFNDEDEFDIWVDDENKIIVPTNEKQNAACEVYKEVIDAIADGHHCDWQDICEAIQFDDVFWLESMGYVSVNPVVHNNKLFYRIKQEDLEKNDKLYKGLFESNGGYFVHQECQYPVEDEYTGQMLFPFGDIPGKMFCVAFHC